MRSAIFTGCILISYAINPSRLNEFNNTTISVLASMFVYFILMDLADWIKNMRS